MEDFIKRLLVEEDELSQKAEKLRAFLVTDAFRSLHVEHQILLHAQLGAMGAYLNILTLRITKLKGETDVRRD